MMSKNITFFNNNKEKYISQNFGKYVLISKQNNLGFFDSYSNAYKNAIKNSCKEGEFLIAHCIDEKTENYLSYIY